MTLPVLLLGLVIALLVGALYHSLRDGGGWRFLFYLALSTVGGAAGQWLGVMRGWSLYKIGALDIGLGLAGSITILLLGDWLSRIESKDQKGV